MKTVNDFKIINEVAVLDGVAFAEEAKVVDEFLRDNIKIEYVSVISKDKRYFELKNSKLILTKEQKFINPYYLCEDKALNDLKPYNKKDLLLESSSLEELQQRIKHLENSKIKLIEMLEALLVVLKNN